MRLADLLDRLHERRAKGVWRRALDDVRRDRLARRDVSRSLGQVLAIAVLAIPVAFIALGLFLVWAALPSIPGALFGGLFTVAGLWLLPRRTRLPDEVLRRAEMPQTFALIDRITARLDGPQVTGLRIEDDFNAYAMQTRGEVILGFGAILWDASRPAERIAVMAHEVGHFVNGDPRRIGVVGQAHRVLDQWHDLVVPDGSGGESAASEVVQAPLAIGIELLQGALTRLTYADSQRAEYLADALAARVAGRDAMIASLALVLCAPEVEARMNRHYGASTPRGAAWFRDMTAHLRGLSADRVDVLLREAEAQNHTVDQSHPPTHLRIALLEQVPDGPVPDADWNAIDREWAPHLERLGDKWFSRAQVQ